MTTKNQEEFFFLIYFQPNKYKSHFFTFKKLKLLLTHGKFILYDNGSGKSLLLSRNLFYPIPKAGYSLTSGFL